MEHTGVYRQLLITKLVEKQAKFDVEVPIQIIRSIEVQRGTEISPFCPNLENSGLSKY